jgi:hypothetical protein
MARGDGELELSVGVRGAGGGAGAAAADHVAPISLGRLILAGMVAGGVQYGWALQLSLLTPYVQVYRRRTYISFVTTNIMRMRVHVRDQIKMNILYMLAYVRRAPASAYVRACVCGSTACSVCRHTLAANLNTLAYIRTYVQFCSQMMVTYI